MWKTKISCWKPCRNNEENYGFTKNENLEIAFVLKAVWQDWADKEKEEISKEVNYGFRFVYRVDFLKSSYKARIAEKKSF